MAALNTYCSANNVPGVSAKMWLPIRSINHHCCCCY
jgi:hypothetical protein